MLTKKKNRSLNRLKDLYFIAILRRRYRWWRKEISRRESANEPPGIWLYLIQKFVMESTHYFTPANLMSFCRGLLSYPLYLLFMEGRYIAAALIFVVSLATDFFDGHLARAFSQETASGKLIDPLFDKTTIFALGVALVQLGMIPLWLAITILSLESLLIIMAIILKPLASALGLNRPTGANDYGKWKFASQCVSLFLFILSVLLGSISTFYPYIHGSAIMIAELSLIFAFGSICEHAFPGILKKSPDNLMRHIISTIKTN